MKKILYFLVVLVTACQQGDVISIASKDSNTGDGSEIGEFKDYFSKELNGYKFRNAIFASMVKKELKPSWDEVVSQKTNSTFVLAVPLKLDENYKVEGLISERYCILEKDLKTNAITANIAIVDSKNLEWKKNIFSFIDQYRTGKISNFTGRVTLYDIGYTYQEYTEFKSGASQHSGKVTSNPPSTTKSARKTEDGCTDWYLVIRVNGEITSVTYLYTRCRCEYTRIGAGYDCGGGPGGGTSPSVDYINETLPPGSRALAVHSNPCDFVNDMLTRMGSSNPPREVFGILTQDNRYLVTQRLQETGGNVNGVYRDPSTGQGLYVWPVNANESTPTYAGVNQITVEGVQCWSIPINAIVHTHPNSTTNNVTPEDISLASRLPTTRFFMVNSAFQVFMYNGSSTQYSWPSDCTTLQ